MFATITHTVLLRVLIIPAEFRIPAIILFRFLCRISPDFSVLETAGRAGRTAASTARGPPSTATIRNSLPAFLKPCLEGWDVLPHNEAFEVLTEDQFSEQHLKGRILGTYMHFADSMEASLRQSGAPNDLLHRYLKLFPNSVMEKIVEYTNQELARRQLPRTSNDELRQMIMLSWARSMYGFSTGKLWANEFAAHAQKHKFVLPDEARFTSLLSSIRGFPVTGRHGDSTQTWNKSNTNFKKFREIEHDLFAASVEILLYKKNGTIVIDDELIGCRASDVEKKTLSKRKRGKDGPVADCVACSATGVLYGMRIRARGETEQENVDKLLDTLPTLTHAGDSVDLRCYFRPEFQQFR